MNKIRTSSLRTGNFTSSEIVALTKSGKAKGTLGAPALTYIEECNMERFLGRPLDNEQNARPLTWGQLVEGRVFELLGIEYQLVSKETIVHPEFNYWSGSPDAIKFDEGRTVCDIKCPLTLKSFAQLTCHDGNTGLAAILNIRENHKDGEKYYWQLVSNAILTGARYAELIVYAPFQKELEAIRDIARMMDDEKQYRFRWLDSATDDELPYLIDNGRVKNINIIRFEVPEEDKDFLIQRVIQCGSMLKDYSQVAI